MDPYRYGLHDGMDRSRSGTDEGRSVRGGCSGDVSPKIPRPCRLSPCGQWKRVHEWASRSVLPCPGYHSHPRALWSKARGVVRSRPYHKNDNPHVEEKNNSIIRKFVGYDRHDSQAEIDLLNRLYQSLHFLVNWFLPSQKLLHKMRTGSHITKVYDQAQTPCARMLAREDVSEETKQQLRSTCATLDMTSLQHEILHCQEQLDVIAKRRQPRAIKKRGNYAYFLDESTA